MPTLRRCRPEVTGRIHNRSVRLKPDTTRGLKCALPAMLGFAPCAPDSRRRPFHVPCRAGRCRRPSEHRLHHVGRSCRARHWRVRVARQPDPQHRSPGPRGRDPAERVRDQLDLHAEPRRDPDRPVCTPERRPGVQPLRQRADDGGATAPAGRVSHGDDRQVAPRERSRRLRSVGDPARPGRLHEPAALHGDGREDVHGPVRDRRDHGPGDRLHQEPAPGQAVLPDGPQQGAAPAVGAGRQAPGAVRGPLDPRARNALGYLRDAHGRAPRKPPARGRRPHTPRSQARAARGPHGHGSHGAGCRSSPWS